MRPLPDFTVSADADAFFKNLPSGFPAQFVNAVFLQDLLLSHMLSSADVSDKIFNHIDTARHMQFETDAHETPDSELWKKIRDKLPGEDAMSKDFQAKKLLSVLPPMRTAINFAQAGGMDKPIPDVAGRAAMNKMRTEFLKVNTKQGVMRSVMLNVKEATVGNKQAANNNEYAGAALVVTEATSLSPYTAMTAELHAVHGKRADLRPFGLEYLKYSVEATVPTIHGRAAGSNPPPGGEMFSIFCDHPSPDKKHESTELLPTNWVDLYTIWNVAFMMEFVGFNPLMLSKLFMPTLLQGGRAFWLVGRCFSLFLVIHAQVMKEEKTSYPQVPDTAAKHVGQNNRIFGIALLRRYGILSSSSDTYLDAFGLPQSHKEYHKGTGGFLGATGFSKLTGPLIPLCKVDQEFRQFVSDICSFDNFAAMRCTEEPTDLAVCSNFRLVPGSTALLNFPELFRQPKPEKFSFIRVAEFNNVASATSVLDVNSESTFNAALRFLLPGYGEGGAGAKSATFQPTPLHSTPLHSTPLQSSSSPPRRNLPGGFPGGGRVPWGLSWRGALSPSARRGSDRHRRHRTTRGVCPGCN